MGTEHRWTVNLEKISSFFNVLLFALWTASLFLILDRPSISVYIGCTFLSFLNLCNVYYLFIQKKHTLLSNFGVLAQVRYLFESLGPEFRQYLYSSDIEGRPFNRALRADIYKKAKGDETSAAFGSLLNFNSKELKFKHSFYPEEEVQKFSLTFEGQNPYTISKPLMIGAMSYGALGQKAVRALTRGAKKAGIPLNTGEGGWPQYHLMEEGDLIFQMGTAKFGVRTPDGRLDPDRLEALSKKKQIKMIEIKFSQGAKPGKGGLLPKEKITEEIARLRGIEMGQDAVSPPCHQECVDEKSTVFFIKKIQEISSLPVGIKFCFGQSAEFVSLVQAMKDHQIFPSFISLDGAEGGTGAAPKIFMDHIGWPIFKSLPLVHKILKEMGVRDKIKLTASGKLVNSGRQMMALALGADAIYTARGFMMAIGCIQALRCNNNTCPVGITSHAPHLQKGLNIEEKSNRAASYVESLNHDYYEMMKALGLKSFEKLDKSLLIFNEKEERNPPEIPISH